MKFTLIAQDEPFFNTNVENLTKRTIEFKSDSLIDIVAEFELFLKGSGYLFDHLEVFNESDDENCEFDQLDPVFDEETAGPVWGHSVKTENNKSLFNIHPQHTDFQKKVK